MSFVETQNVKLTKVFHKEHGGNAEAQEIDLQCSKCSFENIKINFVSDHGLSKT